MNFTAPRKSLLSIVQQAASLVQPKAAVTIMRSVRITVTADGVSVLGMQPTASLDVRGEATVTEPGVVCIDAAVLTGALSAAGGDTVTVTSADHGKVVVKAAGVTYKLAAVGDEMVLMPPLGDAPTFAVTSAFTDALARMAMCVAVEGNKYGLNGAMMERGDTGLRIVGTDGLARMAYAECAATGEIPESRSRLLPGVVIKTILAMCSGKGATISMSDRGGEVRTDTASLRFRCVETLFPPYREVLPAHKYTAAVGRDVLLGLLRQVLPLAHGASKEIKITFGNDAIRMESATVDAGDADASVEAAASGSVVSLKVNGQLVVDALNAMPDGSVSIGYTDRDSPITMSMANLPALWLVMILRWENN